MILFKKGIFWFWFYKYNVLSISPLLVRKVCSKKMGEVYSRRLHQKVIKNVCLSLRMIMASIYDFKPDFVDIYHGVGLIMFKNTIKY